MSKEFLTNGWFRYYCQLASIYSFHFYGWLLHKPVMLPISYYVIRHFDNWSSGQLVIFTNQAFCHKSFCQLVISLSGHFITSIWTADHSLILSFCSLVISLLVILPITVNQAFCYKPFWRLVISLSSPIENKSFCQRLFANWSFCNS